MVIVRSVALTIAFFFGVVLSTPLQAQTTGVLNISARVVQQCTVSATSKLELVILARRLNDPGLIRRCSKGVVSRVDRRVIRTGDLRSLAARSASVSRNQTVRSTVGGKADVVLVTVSY